jgi:hypothetical protein
LCELIGDGRPVVRVGRDAEPCPPAETAAPLSVVQGDQHDAVLGPVSEQVGQGIGQFGRCAQGHLVLPGQVVPIVAAPARRVARAVSPLPAAPADVIVTGRAGGFAVIRHAVTIPRILKFRFALWITLAMTTT